MSPAHSSSNNLIFTCYYRAVKEENCMVKIKLLDEKWMEDTINGLLAAEEGITDL